MASVTRKVINTKKAPQPIGPYNQAVVVDSTVYVSGTLGLDPNTGEFAGKDTASQTHQAFKNIGNILEAAGTDFSNVVKTTAILADINDFVTVNDIYKQYFKNKCPARALYQAANLPKLARIEIETIAVVGKVVDK